jgi:hypothetical protein
MIILPAPSESPTSNAVWASCYWEEKDYEDFITCSWEEETKPEKDCK